MVAGVALLLLPDCVGHQCEGDLKVYGGGPSEGAWTSVDTWETNPNLGTWLDYPAQRTWFFNPPGLVGGQAKKLKVAFAYVSPASDPNHATTADQAGDQFTLGSGNVSEFTYRGDGVFLHNDTCAHYYVRAVIVTEAEAADGGVDGSTEDGAGDAPADAPPDTATD